MAKTFGSWWMPYRLILGGEVRADPGAPLGASVHLGLALVVAVQFVFIMKK